jgi:hypothetical protein
MARLLLAQFSRSRSPAIELRPCPNSGFIFAKTCDSYVERPVSKVFSA